MVTLFNKRDKTILENLSFTKMEREVKKQKLKDEEWFAIIRKKGNNGNIDTREKELRKVYKVLG